MAAPAVPIGVRGVPGGDSTVLSVGAIPGAFDEVASSFSVPRLVEEASLVDPSSEGTQPALRARPGAGPRPAAAAAAGPLDRRRSVAPQIAAAYRLQG
eukprot:6599058-Pyramimonas_sp.AAC.1